MRTPRHTLGALITRFDIWVDRPFAALRGSPRADRLFYTASEAANFSALWHGMAWLPVLVAPTPQRMVRAVGTSTALTVESLVVNGPIKSMFRRQRPILAEGGQRPHRLREPKTTSFPSGHATAAMVAAIMLGRGRGPLARAGLFVVAGLVASSRVYVRIHHMSDVVGGILIGIGIGRVLRRILP